MPGAKRLASPGQNHNASLGVVHQGIQFRLDGRRLWLRRTRRIDSAEHLRVVDELEVLADSDSVVLRRASNTPAQQVQQNLYGLPNRRAEQTLTLRITDSTTGGYTEDILILLEGRQRSK